MELLGRRRAFSTDHILTRTPALQDSSSDSTPLLRPLEQPDDGATDGSSDPGTDTASDSAIDTDMSSATQRLRFSSTDGVPPAAEGGSGNELAYLKKIADLELTVVNLKCQLMHAGDSRRGPDDDVELGAFRSVRPSGAQDTRESFLAAVYERGSWLTFLLIFQSFSSFILVANEALLAKHPDIIFFLTMLVGAGGNAGNQAAVRVIRGLAVGTITPRTRFKFLRSEIGMAVALSCFVGFVGFMRAVLSFRTSGLETVAITVALVSIIFISILTGAMLPFVLQYFKFDPAHSSTTIQVIMDILGVLITCAVATAILDMSDIATVLAGDAVKGQLPQQAAASSRGTF